MTDWKPIATAPKDRKVLLWVIGYDDTPYVVGGSWCQLQGSDEDIWEDEIENRIVALATHWMEYPDPPPSN